MLGCFRVGLFQLELGPFQLLSWEVPGFNLDLLVRNMLVYFAAASVTTKKKKFYKLDARR